MSEEYTKGKWTLSNTHNFSGTYVIWVECNGKRIFSIRENSSNISLNQFEANANLIAAAPELLDACEKISRAHPDGNPVFLIQEAKAAIAAAKE